MRTYLILTLFISVIFAQLSWAEIPQTMTHQGILKDANGEIVADGNYTIIFKIYDVETGGTPLWIEDHLVLVVNGIFNVILGSETPLDLPFTQEYWLGITIQGSEELSPRLKLNTVAYSFNSQMVAGTSDTSNIFPANGEVGIGTKNPQADLDVKGTVSIFGEWEERQANTVYHAETDGLVIAYVHVGPNDVLAGYTDSNNPPTTRRTNNNGNRPGAEFSGITMPVRKGDYWRVLMTSSVTVYWLPLGINFD